MVNILCPYEEVYRRKQLKAYLIQYEKIILLIFFLRKHRISNECKNIPENSQIVGIDNDNKSIPLEWFHGFQEHVPIADIAI